MSVVGFLEKNYFLTGVTLKFYQKLNFSHKNKLKISNFSKNCLSKKKLKIITIGLNMFNMFRIFFLKKFQFFQLYTVKTN